MKKSLLGLICLLAIFLGTLTGAGAVQYTMLDLGTLDGAPSYATTINDNGEIFGRLEGISSNELRVFHWDSLSGMREFELSSDFVFGVTNSNSSGQLVGAMRGEGYSDHAFLWDSSQGIQDMGITGSGGANGVNSNGKVVGVADYQGFLWDSLNGVRWLTAFGGPASTASAINDSDQIVGTTYTSDKRMQAYMWQDGHVTDLGTLGGGSAARDINNLGQIVGWAGTNSTIHAFLWDSVSGMQDLGTLGGVRSDAAAINNGGTIAGTAYTASGERHAFVWDSLNGMQDLGSLWGISEAVAINNSGMIVGYSELADGSIHAVLWNPVPEPSSFLAIILGLGGIAVKRKMRHP